MHKNTIRGFVLGLISGITLGTIGYHKMSETVVDRVAERVIERMIDPSPKPDPLDPPKAPMVLRIAPPAPVVPTRYFAPPRALTKAELFCLAKNIYHEAGVENDDGKIMVGQVTLNRLDHARWGKSLCGVVYQRKQFSWTNSDKLRKELPKGPLWEASKRAATAVASGERIPGLEKALFYHTDYIEAPDWADKRYLITQVGVHLVYFNDRKA